MIKKRDVTNTGPQPISMIKKRDIINTGPQLTSMIKKRDVTNTGPNWPYRCLDLKQEQIVLERSARLNLDPGRGY